MHCHKNSKSVVVVDTEENEADEQEELLEIDSDEDCFDICLDEEMIQ